MTLSRRDEFAARAMTELLRRGEHWANATESAAKAADKLIAELDRTAPKPDPSPEIEDDGREISSLFVDESLTAGMVYFAPGDAITTTSDARLFAHRILKLCDEIEGK